MKLLRTIQLFMIDDKSRCFVFAHGSNRQFDYVYSCVGCLHQYAATSKVILLTSTGMRPKQFGANFRNVPSGRRQIVGIYMYKFVRNAPSKGLLLNGRVASHSRPLSRVTMFPQCNYSGILDPAPSSGSKYIRLGNFHKSYTRDTHK